MSVEEAVALLETSVDGLAESEAKRRLELFGRNEVAEKKENPVREFLARYWGPMPWLLELAIALSFLLGHYPEVVIIFVLLTINATIGFLHTRGSRRALELLKRKLAVKAKNIGIWRLDRKTKVATAGNSLAVRIRRRLADLLGLTRGMEVSVHPIGKDKLVVEQPKKEHHRRFPPFAP